MATTPRWRASSSSDGSARPGRGLRLGARRAAAGTADGDGADTVDAGAAPSRAAHPRRLAAAALSSDGVRGWALTLFSEDAGPAAPYAVTAEPTVRVRLLVAYDGTGFHGFSLQPGVRTVGGVLSAALERYLRHTVELTCAGRTDSGVHAWGQVVTFDARASADPVALARAVNRAVRPAVVVREARVVADTYDARRSAVGRSYRYTIRNDPVADPFTAGTAWHVPTPLDLQAMRLACDALLGEHDFASFCRRPPYPGASLVRVVRDAGWVDTGGGMLRFDIEASSFCQQMVRSIVGTLVEVGLGRRKAGEMTGVLRARSRAAAGRLAPPHGLCLWEVRYP